MRYCVINPADQIVNIIEWDGKSQWSPPDGMTLREYVDGDAIHRLTTIPQSITPRQARLVLNVSGLRDSVEAAVAASSRDVRDFWEYALEIERDNELLIGLSSDIGISPQQLDDLFSLAATL